MPLVEAFEIGKIIKDTSFEFSEISSD